MLIAASEVHEHRASAMEYGDAHGRLGAEDFRGASRPAIH
jgi:hypothetical protein